MGPRRLRPMIVGVPLEPGVGGMGGEYDIDPEGVDVFLRVVQLLPGSWDDPHDACDGSGLDRSRLDASRTADGRHYRRISSVNHVRIST